MIWAWSFLAALNTPPASLPPKPSDLKALERGEVIKRIEPVKGAPVPRVRAYILIDAPPQKMFALIDRCGDYKKIMPRMPLSRELSRKGREVVCKVQIKLPMFLGTLNSVTRGVHTVGPPAWGRLDAGFRGLQAQRRPLAFDPVQGEPQRDARRVRAARRTGPVAAEQRAPIGEWSSHPGDAALFSQASNRQRDPIKNRSGGAEAPPDLSAHTVDYRPMLNSTISPSVPLFSS